MTDEEKKQHRERQKRYYLKHADEIREKKKEAQRQYRLEHPEKEKESQKQYYRTPKGRAAHLSCDYNRCDKEKGLDVSNNITVEWILKNIFTSSCAYCGETDWTLLGTDRIDNTKPHTPDNVVCCCGKCNVERNRRYTFEEFKKIKGYK